MRWVPKSDPFDLWAPALAPSSALLAEARRRGLSEETWAWYAPCYLDEQDHSADAHRVREMLRELSHARTIRLLCACADERRCHRSLLLDLIKEEEEV